MFSVIWHHFEAGGWAMWAILFWLIMTLGFGIERLLYLSGAHQRVDVFVAAIHQCLKGLGGPQKAIQVCNQAKSPLARVVRGGLLRVHQGPEGVQTGMDEAALREMPQITKRVGYLALFANLSMLSGLLGTIVGLIKSFASISSESIDSAMKARYLAEGISEAMNCTAFGLLSAIIALVFYAGVSAWASNLEDSIHRESVHVYNLLVKLDIK